MKVLPRVFRLLSMAFVALLLAVEPAGAGPSATLGAPRYRLLELDGDVVKWGRSAFGAGHVVGFAFVDRHEVAGERNCSATKPMRALSRASGPSPSRVRAALLAAMSRWSAIAGIGFVESSEEEDATLLVGTFSGSAGIAFADVSWSKSDRPGLGRLERALICLNANEHWTVEDDDDERTRDLHYVFAHELGHAIGIDHPGRRGAMMASAYDEGARDFTPGDIAAARRLYGPPLGRTAVARPLSPGDVGAR